jgi:transposase
MMRSEGHGVRVHLEHEMDTYTVELGKDTSARSGKRRMRTLQEKRRIVEEVFRGGESVAVIARRHEVNANLVFSWKRQYEKGLLEPSSTALLPVKVRKQPLTPTRLARNPDDEYVEIDLGAGKCMRLRGELARAMLDRVVSALCAR